MGIEAEHQNAEIICANVMHGRLFPKRNNFTYGIYYLSLPLSQLNETALAYNKFGALSFHDKDHGACDGSSLQNWAKSLLARYKLDQADGEIVLVCMPRVLGYVFNPVSFWLCYNQDHSLRAVICEVHNTFGERHSYICAHEDQRPILKNDVLEGQKLFHVSPFLAREGKYHFRFDVFSRNFAAWIDYYDHEGKKQLVTSLIGAKIVLNKDNLSHVFWRYPLVTIKAITLIHWQALKLISKGIKYIKRPEQLFKKHSATNNVTEN